MDYSEQVLGVLQQALTDVHNTPHERVHVTFASNWVGKVSAIGVLKIRPFGEYKLSYHNACSYCQHEFGQGSVTFDQKKDLRHIADKIAKTLFGEEDKVCAC